MDRRRRRRRASVFRHTEGRGPAFEQAALALEAGQVAPDLVETDSAITHQLEKKAEVRSVGQPLKRTTFVTS